MFNSLKDIVRKSSIHVCLVNCGGCNGCDIEVVALLSPKYDLEQYGIYFHNNPREADNAPVSDFIPVDAAVPGCPPRPDEILAAVLAVVPGAIAAKGRAQDKGED